MIEMTLFLVKVILFLLFQTQITNGLTVSIGNYPNHTKFGVNLPKCGLRYLAHTITRDPKCFKNSPGNTSEILALPMLDKLDKISDRIYNGRDAMVGESPWTVRIRIHYMGEDANGEDTNFYAFCTGSLITFEWVLTAAHCFRAKIFDKFVGSDVFAGPKNERRFALKKHIIRHPDYFSTNETIRNISDIALVKVWSKYDQEKDAIFYKLNTICLPNKEFPDYFQDNTTFTGWGIINKHKTFVERLQITEFVLGVCVYNRQMICHWAFNNQSKTCPGDSGGPLFQFSDEYIPRAFEIGVLKGGYNYNCTSENNTDVWTPPMRFIPWILETIANNTKLN